MADTSALGRNSRIRRADGGGALTGGHVGGRVGIGQPRHLAGQAGLAGPPVEPQVRDSGRRGQRTLAVHSDVGVRGLRCGRRSGVHTVSDRSVKPAGRAKVTEKRYKNTG